jgi:DNA-directed RNA polymerase subunit RPC12/RpoP
MRYLCTDCGREFDEKIEGAQYPPACPFCCGVIIIDSINIHIEKMRGWLCGRELVADQKQEVWVCDECGAGCPCKVVINYTSTNLPYVEKQSRFRQRVCLCKEKLWPVWREIGTEIT